MSPRPLLIVTLAAAVALPVATVQAVAAVPAPTHVVRVASNPANARIVSIERRRGTRIMRVYRNVFPGFAAVLDARDIRRIRGYRAVRQVAPVQRLTAAAVVERRTSATGLWGLDRIDQRLPPLDGRIVTASNGAGVNAYVVDSGIRAGQEQFGGRLLSGVSVVGDGRGTEDCGGHGTRVAGGIAGSETGVAPAMWLTPVRVIDCAGNGDSASVIAGLDWVVASHRAGVPAVANMSLVGPRSQILNDAVAAVIADGLAVTVAAGNSPVDACTQSPASAPGAITTGAMTQQDSVASFSAVGPCLDIYAPGYSVLTTATTPSRRGANQVVLASGTSMASAFAAGAVGLGLSLDPALTPRQVAQGITDSATGGALSGVPPATPNLLLYVGNGALPLPVAARPATPRVLSGLTARFTFRRPMGTPAGRFRLTGATGLPGMLTVTRAGRLLSRRHVQAGPFAFRTRVARPMTVLRVQLRPDDIERTPASALVRVTVRRP